jgi:hypothetical protein
MQQFACLSSIFSKGPRVRRLFTICNNWQLDLHGLHWFSSGGLTRIGRSERS